MSPCITQVTTQSPKGNAAYYVDKVGNLPKHCGALPTSKLFHYFPFNLPRKRQNKFNN